MTNTIGASNNHNWSDSFSFWSHKKNEPSLISWSSLVSSMACPFWLIGVTWRPCMALTSSISLNCSSTLKHWSFFGSNLGTGQTMAREWVSLCESCTKSWSCRLWSRSLPKQKCRTDPKQCPLCNYRMRLRLESALESGLLSGNFHTLLDSDWYCFFLLFSSLHPNCHSSKNRYIFVRM